MKTTRHIHHSWFIPLLLCALTGILLTNLSWGATVTVELELVGASNQRQPLPPNTQQPSSHFLNQARSVYGNTDNISDYQQLGSFGQVYPGISVVYFGDEHHLECVFLLATGADPSLIHTRLSNVTTEGTTEAGNAVHTGDGFEIYQHAPVISRSGAGGNRSVSGHLSVNGNGESSISLPSYEDEHLDELNRTHLSVIPGTDTVDSPQYDFYMSKFETTNEQLIRFLNDAEANPDNARGENMVFDKDGNVWINAAMQPGRDEMLQLDRIQIQYNPDRVAGARFQHTMTETGREPYADHPATGLAWFGAVKYCNWLTLQSGRGPNELCYTEGTNAWSWAPATATEWTNGLFSAAEREAWLDYKGFRLPMFRMHDPENNNTNMFNEILKAGTSMGNTNVTFGFGRNTVSDVDANTLENTMSTKGGGTLPVGYFNGLNPLNNTRTHRNRNHYGIHDLSGNVAEWINDPPVPGAPNARSMCGGSFNEPATPLDVDRIIPPYACENGGGFRPLTTYMPSGYTQINILFCFHTPNGTPTNLVSRFGAQFETRPSTPEPPDLSPGGASDDTGDRGDGIPKRLEEDDSANAKNPPGIIYKGNDDDDDQGDDNDQGGEGDDGGGGGGGNRDPDPIIPDPIIPDPIIPDPEPTFRLGLSSENPNSGVTFGISVADISGAAGGATAFDRYYYYGQSVTATAPATVGDNVFQYWKRDGSPFTTSLSITLEMLSDLNLTAVYLSPVPPIQRTLNVNSPAGSVPVTISREDNNGSGSGSTTFSRIYDNGDTVVGTVPATFNGEGFLNWRRNNVPFSSNPDVTVTMYSDITLTATYGVGPASNERRLIVASSNPNSDVPISVSIPDNTGQQNGNTTFERLYDLGAAITLTAPATVDGNIFSHWLRDSVIVSKDPTVDVVLQTDISMTAVYVDPPPDITLTVSSTPVSGVGIAIGTPDNNGDADGSTTFVRYYDSGDSTTVTAPESIAGGSLIFNRWIMNGIPLTTNTATSVSLLANTTLIAVYLPVPPPTPTYDLIIQSQDPDSGVNITVSTPDESGNIDGNTAFTRTYEEGVETALTAPETAPDGHVFVQWLVDGQPYSTSRTINISMYNDHTVTAVYEPPLRHVLTVQSQNPNSSVVVTVDPGDVNGQQNGTTTFTRLYEDGEHVTLTARNPAFPGTSIMLQVWLVDGSPVSSNVTISVSMLQDHTVTAVYGDAGTEENHTLTIQSENSGGGVAIQISEPDINSTTDGTTEFDRLYSYGTAITATAPEIAPNDNVFQHWLLNGQIYTPNRSIDISMLGDHTITAVYDTPPIVHVLTVASRNPDSDIDIAVSTIDNNGDQDGTTRFERRYGDGVDVTLVAPGTAPNGRDVFQSWERDGVDVTTNTSVNFTMFSDIGMTAVYGAPNTFDLTVRSENPDNDVNITVSTPDIRGNTDDSTEFVRTYNPNETTTLVAEEISSDGTYFQEWFRNGASYSTNRTVDVTMLSDLEMTAVYGPPPPAPRFLTVRSDNPNSGVTIGVSPDQRGRGAGDTAFSRIYQDGDTVTVSAPATAGGNNFQQWILDGSPGPTNLTTTFTMYADHEIIAVYGPPSDPEDRTLVVSSRNPNSGVTIDVSNPDNNGNSDGDTTFVRIYTFGDSTTLTAPVQGGTNDTTFLYWELNGSRYSNDRTITIEMLGDLDLTAVYGNDDEVVLTVNAKDGDSGDPISEVFISVAPVDNVGNTTGGTEFQRTYDLGVTATLTAPTTANGSAFRYWERNGTIIYTNPVVNVELLTNVTMTAVYGGEPPQPTLTLTVTSRGPDGPLSTFIRATPDNDANAGGTTTFYRFYNTGTGVTLEAPPASDGFDFDYWELNGALYSNSQTIVFDLFDNQTMTAVYKVSDDSQSGL